MNIYSFVHCFAFWVYIYLAGFVLWKNPKSPVNRSCSLLIAVFAFWSAAIIFVHNVNVTMETAWLVMSVDSVCWVGFAILFLRFTVIFTRREKLCHNIVFNALIMILPIIFIYAQWNRFLIVDFVKTPYGWFTIWSDSLWFHFYSIYYSAAMLLSLYFMFDYGKKSTKSNEKKQASIILTGTIIVLVFGSVTDVLLPKLEIRTVPNIANVIGLIWAVGLVLSVVKYKFMSLTPAMAAEDIISTMADSLLLISPDSNILTVNQYTLDLLGYRKSELINQPVSKIFMEPKNDFFLKSNDYNSLRKTGTIRNRAILYKTKVGEGIPVSFSGSVMKDKDRNLVGIVWIARDMRKMKGLIEKEKKLATTAAITKAEHAKAAELEGAYNALKKTQAILVQSEKLRALGQLGAGVAHELNSPLAGILCLMRSYMKKKEPASQEYEDLKVMIEGCEFMAKIIKDLSEFTKEISNKFEEIKLEDVIESTLILVTPQLRKNGIKIEKEYGRDVPLIAGERRQIQQIVINMVTNARDAMEPEGILEISTMKHEKDGKVFAQMIFKDSGSGMSPDVKDKIFEHFFTTKKQECGVGLGLAIVRSIVENHNGEIIVKTEEGKGTSFIIRLPVAE